MPSPVGHVLAGVAVAWAADLVPGDRNWRFAPSSKSWFVRAGNGLTATCALLAAAPDFDLVLHGHRTVSHSVGAVIVVGLLAAALAAKARRPALRVALMCAAAYGSHLLLDWMGVDIWGPRGLQALWPFSHRWYISGWDIFLQTERRRLLTTDTFLINLRAVTREVAILLPIVLGLWIVRRGLRVNVETAAGLPAQIAGSHHPAQ